MKTHDDRYTESQNLQSTRNYRKQYCRYLRDLEITLLSVISLCAGMQRNPEGRGFCSARDFVHVERVLVIDRNNSLTHVNGRANRIGKIIAEPGMSNQRPAAEINGIDVGFELLELRGRNDRRLVTETR